VVVAAFNLPQDKNYYANNNYGVSYSAPRNDYGLVSTALQYADSSVNWRPFDQNHDGYVDMLWVVHSGVPGEATVTRDNLWSLTTRLTSWPSGESFETRTSVPGAPTVHIRVDRFSVLPELSAVHPGRLTDIGVYCHEFGHALGLPDLYDTSTFGGSSNVGPGNWSLMSTGGYGTDGNSPEYPAHMGAWPLLWLGWRDVIRPASDSLMVLGPLATGAPVVEFWFQGESNPEHFLIENRQRMSFDRNLPSEGLIVYHVDENVMALGVPSNRVNTGTTPGLRLVEADALNDLVAGRNRGDERDPFPGYLGITVFDDDTRPSTRTYRGAPTNIALRAIEAVGDNMRFLLQVRAAGWDTSTPMTQGDFNPVWPSGAANRAVSMADGSVIAAFSEPVAGRPQIVLRSRGRVDPWGPAVPVSASPSSATDPTIATLPGGTDLVMAWSDSRHGSKELYYRSRIGGVGPRASPHRPARRFPQSQPVRRPLRPHPSCLALHRSRLHPDPLHDLHLLLPVRHVAAGLGRDRGSRCPGGGGRPGWCLAHLLERSQHFAGLGVERSLQPVPRPGGARARGRQQLRPAGSGCGGGCLGRDSRRLAGERVGGQSDPLPALQRLRRRPDPARHHRRFAW
jgi:M6 family metalloprotease-like protein